MCYYLQDINNAPKYKIQKGNKIELTIYLTVGKGSYHFFSKLNELYLPYPIKY